MALVSLRCPQCGANLEAEEGRDYYFCTYCGTKFKEERRYVTVDGNVDVTVKGTVTTQNVFKSKPYAMEEETHKETNKNLAESNKESKTTGIILLIVGVVIIVIAFSSGAEALILFSALPFFKSIQCFERVTRDEFTVSTRTIDGECPYCGNKVTINQRSQYDKPLDKLPTTHKCPHCEKIFNIRNGNFESIG